MFEQRLKLARKRAGISLAELSEIISPKVSAQAISKYESGKMMPSSSVLVGLGKALNVSLDFLMGGQIEELCEVEFRKHSTTSVKDRARAESMVIEKLENYLALEDILDRPSMANPFENCQINKIESLDSLEKTARNLRRDWKLGIDPIPSMSELLENKGMKVLELDLPDRFDGLTCSVKRNGERPDTSVIIVASKTNVERKRFNLAHELAHRIIQDIQNPDIRLEKAMNRFAGAFLVPEEHLKEAIGNDRSDIAYNELIELKHFYGVSAAALLVRLKDVGIIAENTMANAFRGFAKGWRKSEPEPIALDSGIGAFEKPQIYNRMVWQALAEQLITPIRAAQFLDISIEKVEFGIRGPNTS